MTTPEIPEPLPRPRLMTFSDQIENRFTYHPPKDDQPRRYELIRKCAKTLAIAIGQYTPQSREQSLAFTALEEAVFWANASIARNE